MGSKTGLFSADIIARLVLHAKDIIDHLEDVALGEETVQEAELAKRADDLLTTIVAGDK